MKGQQHHPLCVCSFFVDLNIYIYKLSVACSSLFEDREAWVSGVEEALNSCSGRTRLNTLLKGPSIWSLGHSRHSRHSLSREAAGQAAGTTVDDGHPNPPIGNSLELLMCLIAISL